MGDRNGKRMVVYGRSGSGKTHLVKEQFLTICDRVVIIDPEEEYADQKGFQTLYSLAALLDVLHDCHDSSFKVCFVPDARFEEQQLHEVSCLIERLQEPYKQKKSDKKVLLVVDEMHMSFPLNMRDEFYGFKLLCRRGRKRGINIIGITQRPADVGKAIRANLDRLIAFNFSDPADLKVIREILGSEAETKVQSLQQYQYLAAENGSFEIMGP